MFPYKTDTALQTMQAFEHVIYRHSGKHRHQGGLAIFVLESEGYTLVDGKRHDWKAGDLILLPIKPGGVSHQHFNANPEKPARWLALITNSYRAHPNYKVDVVFVGVTIFMGLTLILTHLVKMLESRLSRWRPEVVKTF